MGQKKQFKLFQPHLRGPTMIRLSCILALMFFFACARQVPPTGGKKDETPPRLIRAYPENKSLNVSTDEITLEFDEYIKENNLQKQLIITPRIEHEYKSRIAKKQLKLLFEQPFPDSTTFTLNFREGVKDITESNPAENLKFVFSTGDYLDSVSVSGQIRDLFTGQPVDDATVSLFDAADTLDIFNSQPIYLTKTSDSGFYSIENIKNGQYKIYASMDANQNLKTESRSEAYGFKVTPLDLQDSLVGVELIVQHLDINPIKVQSSRPTGRHYEIKFNKFITDFSLAPIDSSITLYAHLVDQNKTLRIYPDTEMPDSLLATYQVTDSAATALSDSVYLKFVASDRNLEKPTLEVTPANNEAIDKEFLGILKFNKPITKVVNDSMYFQYDSLNKVYLDPNLDLVWNQTKTEARLRKTLDPSLLNSSDAPKKSELILHIGSGSFITADTDTVGPIEKSYSFKKPEDYGVIAGNIETEFNSFTVQLVDKNLKAIESIVSTSENPLKNYRFEALKPGDYGFRILIDDNESGYWEPGNILRQQEPEKIVFYVNPDDGSTSVNLIQNWELTGINLSF